MNNARASATRNTWTMEDDVKLLDFHKAGKHPREIGPLIDRTESAVWSRLNHHNIYVKGPIATPRRSPTRAKAVVTVDVELTFPNGNKLSGKIPSALADKIAHELLYAE